MQYIIHFKHFSPTYCMYMCKVSGVSHPSPSTTVSVRGMYGGTTREDPEYPGILSIPDTVSVRWYMYVWGDNSGGSRVSRDT